MIKTYEFASAGIKFAFDEEPVYNGLAVEEYKDEINKSCFIPPYFPLHSLGMEVWKHIGGRIYYGLLSCEISYKDDIDLVSLSVSYTKRNMEEYENAILDNKGYIFKGLLQEYLGAVVEGAKAGIIKQETIPCCNLSFNFAANCEVGSNQHFFNLISEFVVEFIFMYYKENFQSHFIDSCIEKIAQKFNF